MAGIGHRGFMGRRKVGGDNNPSDNFGSNLYGWYSAKNSIITDTSGLVDSWQDLSGFNRHIVASGTARPTLGINTLDGVDVIFFENNTRLQYTEGAPNTQWSYPFGFVALLRTSSSANNQILIDTNSIGYRSYFKRASNQSHMVQIERTFSSSPTIGVWMIVTAIARAPGINSDWRINGVIVDSGIISTSPPGLTNRAITLAASLYGNANPAQHLDGDVAEFCFFNSDDITSIENTEQYFNNLYNLTLL